MGLIYRQAVAVSSSRLHVLHVIDSLGIGGAERMLVDLANATVDAGHRVSVCITRREAVLARELDPRIEVLVLDRTSRLAPRESLRLARWVRHQRVDVLHVHMRSSLAYMLVLRVARVVRVPLVFHDHYGSIEVDTAVPGWFRIGHPMIGHYVGVYDKLRDWAQHAGMPAARTTTIPNGVDLQRLAAAQSVDLRAELGVGRDVVLGVLVASFKRDKGIELAIEAVAASRHRDRLRLAIAGAAGDPAYASECRAAIAAHGLADVIHLLGPRTDLPGLLPSADFALLSSHTESGPLVLIEYLAAGLPIVSTLVGDVGRRLAALEVPGFVPPRDRAAFTEELDTVVGMTSAARAARGALGRRALTASYDVRASIPSWCALYRSVLAPAG
jgi:glycosyltransferase involved in cell wall biosynthesis